MLTLSCCYFLLTHSYRYFYRNITLSVVGSWDDESVYSEGTCIQPIDPLLWLTHNSVMDKQQDGGDPHAPHNRNIGRLKSQPSIGSSSMSSSMPSTTGESEVID